MSDKTGSKGRDQQWGARIGIVWTLSRALGPAKENVYALEHLKGYIVWGCWELKRKFRLIGIRGEAWIVGYSKRTALAHVCHHSGLTRLLGMLPNKHVLLVLNYHRIGNAAECEYDSGVFSATEEQLSEELGFLKHNFHIVALDEVLDIIERKQEPREALVLLTVDDGYIDSFTKAFPILRAQCVQALFFIPTMFIGTNHFTWWDTIAFIVKGSRKTAVNLPLPSPRQFDLARQGKYAVIDELLSIYKSGAVSDPGGFITMLEEVFDAQRPEGTDRCFMNWDEVRALARGGMSIGAHSHTHEILAGLSEERQLEEVTKSKALLEEHLETVVNAFAYPVGLRNSFSSTTRAAVQKGNYRVAFSFYGGLNVWGEIDRYDIRRQAPTCSPFDRFELQTISAKATGRFWV